MNTTPVLNDDEMRSLGFTQYVPGSWYFTRRIDDRISLNIRIDTDTGEWSEHVLNEDFCQPEYYMNMKPEWREKIVAEIDKNVATFRSAGLDVFVNHEEYGWPV